MLKSITLQNYKSFKNKTNIDIKPLTILCGVNSSGKSSIIKSLLLLKQSFQNHNTKGHVTYNDKYVNNGQFQSMAFDSKMGIVISNKFEMKSDSINDRYIYKEFYRTFFSEIIKTKELNFPRFIDAPFHVLYDLEIYLKSIYKYQIKISHNRLDNPIILSLTRQRENQYTLSIRNLIINNILYNNLNDIETICYFDGIRITNLYANNPPREIDIQSVFSFITMFFNHISTQYQYGIQHIAPLRYAPSRFYISDSSYTNVGISGEKAIQVLNEYSDKNKPNIMPPEEGSLSNPISEYKIGDVVNKWLQYIDMGNYNLIKSDDDDIIKLLIGKRSIVDVGFGVSQILPILVEGSIMNKYQTLLLEQPEIHLHPKAQMKIADYLFSLAITNKQVVLETHSDHIINRIVRRCLETPELIEMVSILFLSQDRNGVSSIQKIKIDEHLGIEEAPPDFFDQYASETDIIINMGYQNMMRDRSKNV